MSDRDVVQLAIAHLDCRSCRAQRGEPCAPACRAQRGASCVPFRTLGDFDYGNWYVHVARRNPFDKIWEVGFRDGMRHAEVLAVARARKAIENHEAHEGQGGGTECTCGWPTRADFDAHAGEDPKWFPDFEEHLFQMAKVLP